MTAANPPAQRPANDLLPQPSAELLAHFRDPALRKRLLGKARWAGTPERRAEDVVHTTMTDAWRQRHLWPATVDELERWLFHALHNDIIDAARADKRMPLQRKATDAKDAKPAEEVLHDEEDGDPPAMIATTQVEPTLVARDGLRSANEYVESRPRLRRSFVWLMQNKMGMSYADIAAREGCDERVITNAVARLRAELRMVYGPLVVFAAFALIYVLVRGLHGYVNDQATDPNAPKPTPNIVAPPAPPPAPAPTTAPQLSADDLRARAFAECDAGKWAECYGDLEDAKATDPAGDKSPRVKAARSKAIRALSGKPF